jgi:hypothetical protein
MNIIQLQRSIRLYPDITSKLVILLDWAFNRKRFANRINIERRLLVLNFKCNR